MENTWNAVGNLTQTFTSSGHTWVDQTVSRCLDIPTSRRGTTMRFRAIAGNTATGFAGASTLILEQLRFSTAPCSTSLPL